MAVDVRERVVRDEALAADTPGERLARGGGWWTVILTVILVGTMAEALNAAEWSEGLELVRFAVLGGVLLSLLLALTRWEGPFPVLYSALASVFWITILQNNLLLGGPTLQRGVTELFQRYWSWTVALLNGSPSADNLIFVTQLSYLGWWIGYFAMWSLIRRQSVLPAVIPVGLALLINIYYSPYNLTAYMIIYLLVVLMLGIRIELTRNESRWQLAHIRYAPDIYLDFVKAGIIFAVVVIGAAWVMPDVSKEVTLERVLRPFEKPWSKFEDMWARMYRSVENPGVASGPAAFGKTLLLGGPVNLSERPIFDAVVPQRSYWRAAIYDTYTGQGWLNTDHEVIVLERNQPMGEPVYGLTAEITATIHPLEEGQKTIFSPPQPLRTTLPADADVTRLTGREVGTVVSALRSRVRLGPDTSYQVVAAMTLAPVEDLRTDARAYPEWILGRYLQLPDSLPQRVVDLAREVTAPYDNAFDKASALESYLRTYAYNQNIAAPPPKADGVDYFLFDVKEGYCDYYASAMAVMLRAVGIPARLVAGYTPGEYVASPPEDAGRPTTRDTYQVLERNAHAWIEAFFPSYGWIQFEPTASEPMLVRPLPSFIGTPEPTAVPEDDLDQLRDLNRGQLPPGLGANEPRSGALARWIGRNWPEVAIGLAVLALAAVATWLLRRRRAALFGDSELLARLFGLLEVWAQRLRVPWPASHTPLEHAEEFGQRLPEGASAVQRLAGLFVAQRYGRQPPTPEALAETVEDWKRIEPFFWKRWLRRALRP